MGCLSGLAKYILFLFNFVIVVCAIILIAFGAISLVNDNKGVEGVTSYSVGGFAVAIGVIIFFIAFFGCCGAIKQNSCMLTTYAIILIVLLILQIVLGALAFVAIQNDDSKLEKDITEAIKKLFDRYTEGSEDDKKLVDDLQQELECCGVTGSGYWLGEIPDSCCDGSCSTNSPYKEGCGKAFTNLIIDNFKIIGGVAIGFAVVELLGAIFACMVRTR